MKSPEYVALVTGVYRAALDRAAADPEGFAVTPGEWATLEEAFSRGFTEGRSPGSAASGAHELAPAEQPRRARRAASRPSSGRRATLALDRALDADDTIEVWTGRGRFAQTAGTHDASGGEPTRARARGRARRDRARAAPRPRATACSASRTPRCSTPRAARTRTSARRVPLELARRA